MLIVIYPSPVKSPLLHAKCNNVIPCFALHVLPKADVHQEQQEECTDMRIITNSLHSDRACFGYSKPAVHIRALLSVKLKYQIRLRHHDMSEDGQYLKRRRVCDAGMGTSIQALVDEAAHQASDSFKVPGLVMNNHVFKVPLDHSKQVRSH